MMIRPKLMKLALAGMLAMGSAMAADVVVRVGPPRPLVEHRGPPPGREYVWVNGYHRYDVDSTCGSRGAGTRRLVGMRTGLLITGCTAMAAGCWWKVTGDR